MTLVHRRMQDDNPRNPLRLVRDGIERAGLPVEILLNGRAIPALEGESVAAALTAAGSLALRKTREGAGRGLYCGMGVCFDCRVTIDGRPGQRSCLAIVRPGMRIDIGDQPPATNAGTAAVRPEREEHCAVLVLGAGPAGLAAADAASEFGADIAILDERPAAGGQYFKPLGSSHRFRGGRHTDRQFGRGAELVERVRSRGVRMFNQVTVWDAQARPEGGVIVRAVDPAGSLAWTAGKLVVATGAYESSWPVPGWTLPGVMTTGAAQTLARSYRVAPGRRILVAGNGPLNFQVAADLARSGVQVVAVAEAAQPVSRAPLAELLRLVQLRPDLMWQGAKYLGVLRRHGVPVFYRHVLARIAGNGRAERAVIAAIDAAGAVLPGSEREFEIDAVCTGYGFSPASEITRLIGCRHAIDSRHGTALVANRDRDGRTSIRDVFIAGDAGGIWGAHSALCQGTIAGAAAGKDIAGERTRALPGLDSARQRLQREAEFQTALWRVFSMPHFADRLASDGTIVCRCENVSFGEVRREIARGALDVPSIKRATRCGMGHCQGRYCSPAIAGILAARTGVAVNEQAFAQPQAPVRPVPIDSIAMERAELTMPAPLNETVPEAGATGARQIADVGTLIIGGGVIGLWTALQLARKGEDVAVAERGLPHAEASGANAGNLHVQFQTFGIADFDSDAARGSISTLSLQRDSARLWVEFAGATESDIEVEIKGGLTVADDETSLARLKRKVDLERSAGLHIELIGGDEVRGLAPYLSPRILAASLSRDEGKLNPLKASPAVLAAALAAGARLYTRTRVTGIERAGTGFIVQTDRGTFAAKRIVNAAGAWAGSVAALVGETIPVRPNPIQMLVTEAAPAAIGYYLAHAGRRLTLKQTASGNLLVGGGWKAVFDPGSGRMRASADGFSGNLAVVLDMLPEFGALHVIRSWTGIAFSTPPTIGASAKMPGLFHAVAQNGMTLGPVIGRICSDVVLGREPGYDLRPFSPGRFS